MKNSLRKSLIEVFRGVQFSLTEAYEKFCPKGYPKEQIRARIYENLGKDFKRIGKGLYVSLDDSVVLIQADGRNLSEFKDNSFQFIVTDHPWCDLKSNKGGNRNFALYDTFEYTLEDFREKARVLQEGCFCAEFLPAENENNYDYLYKIKKMAKEAGLNYFCKVPWIKGTFVSNTGRKAKNSEDIMIFVKGKPRKMRPDAKKDKSDPDNAPHYMSGCRGMLPTAFNVQPPAKKDKIHQSEKPVELIENILEYFTFEGEYVLDQFAGSGVVGEACIRKNRLAVLIEKSKDCIEKIKERLNLNTVMEV